MNSSLISRVRSFNRIATLQVGALNDSYLGRGRSLGTARLLFEIGPGGSDIASLRERLGLDSGYASRLLRSLEKEELITIDSDPEDGRRRRVTLSDKGVSEWQAYDTLSDDLVRDLLDNLTSLQKERLVEAMAEVELLLTAASVTISIEDHGSADARACVEAYFKELDTRFEGGFDPGSGGYAGTRSETTRETFLIARLHGRAIGCGTLKELDAETGEIKRMWVSPDARGLGVARRLLTALEAKASQAGMRRLVLDTNRSLAEAQALYRKAGYKEIRQYNDNAYADFWFEKLLRPEDSQTVGAL